MLGTRKQKFKYEFPLQENGVLGILQTDNVFNCAQNGGNSNSVSEHIYTHIHTHTQNSQADYVSLTCRSMGMRSTTRDKRSENKRPERE